MAKTLSKAVRSADLWRVKFLITRGLRINSRDEEDEGVLLAALHIEDDRKRNKVFRWLLAQGADALAISKSSGRDALFWSTYLNRHSEVDVILKDFAGELDFTRKDRQGRTLLHYAVLHDSSVILKSLCQVMRKYELSVDVADAEGLTPYLCAIRLAHSACAQVLCEVGLASPHKCDEKTLQSSHFWEALGEKERKETKKQRNMKKNKALQKALRRVADNHKSTNTVPEPLLKYNKLSFNNQDIKEINDKLELIPTPRLQPSILLPTPTVPAFLPAIGDVAVSVHSSSDVTHSISRHDLSSTISSSRHSVQSESLESVSFVKKMDYGSFDEDRLAHEQFMAGSVLRHAGQESRMMEGDFLLGPATGRAVSCPMVAVTAFMGVLSQQCTAAFRQPARPPLPPQQPDVTEFRVVAKAGLFTARMKKKGRHKLDSKIIEEPELEGDARVATRSARRKPVSRQSTTSFDRDHLPVLVSS